MYHQSNPISRLFSVFRGSDESLASVTPPQTAGNNNVVNSNRRRGPFLFGRNRPTRPGNGQVDLIANMEGNRALQSSKSFVTQGIILPVNIDKSSLTINKKSETELEIVGKLDSNVSCRIYGQSDSWKEKCLGSSHSDGLGQDFSLIIPNFASFGPKAIELIVSELTEKDSTTKHNKEGKFSNPFYCPDQYTKISLTRNESGMVFLKAEDQYIKLRNKNFSLLEIFGKPLSSIRSNTSSPTSYCSDGLSNRECIVCMSEVKDTIVLPCRHMCLCSECADTIRGRSDKCPLCRQGNFTNLFSFL
jgi:hypothetical protein